MSQRCGNHWTTERFHMQANLQEEQHRRAQRGAPALGYPVPPPPHPPAAKHLHMPPNCRANQAIRDTVAPTGLAGGTLGHSLFGGDAQLLLGGLQRGKASGKAMEQ